MATYWPIPVPLTIEDEEEQLEYAILRSLAQTDDSMIDIWRRDTPTEDHENATSLQNEEPVATSEVAKAVQAPSPPSIQNGTKCE